MSKKREENLIMKLHAARAHASRLSALVHFYTQLFDRRNGDEDPAVHWTNDDGSTEYLYGSEARERVEAEVFRMGTRQNRLLYPIKGGADILSWDFTIAETTRALQTAYGDDKADQYIARLALGPAFGYNKRIPGSEDPR